MLVVFLNEPASHRRRRVPLRLDSHKSHLIPVIANSRKDRLCHSTVISVTPPDIPLGKGTAKQLAFELATCKLYLRVDYCSDHFSKTSVHLSYMIPDPMHMDFDLTLFYQVSNLGNCPVPWQKAIKRLKRISNLELNLWCRISVDINRTVPSLVGVRDCLLDNVDFGCEPFCTINETKLALDNDLSCDYLADRAAYATVLQIVCDHVIPKCIVWN